MNRMEKVERVGEREREREGRRERERVQDGANCTIVKSIVGSTSAG